MKRSLTVLMLILLLVSIRPDARRVQPIQGNGDSTRRNRGLLARPVAGHYGTVCLCCLVVRGDLDVYEVHNNGAWYNFGCLFGLACFFGSGGNRASWRWCSVGRSVSVHTRRPDVLTMLQVFFSFELIPVSASKPQTG